MRWRMPWHRAVDLMIGRSFGSAGSLLARGLDEDEARQARPHLVISGSRRTALFSFRCPDAITHWVPTGPVRTPHLLQAASCGASRLRSVGVRAGKRDGSGILQRLGTPDADKTLDRRHRAA